MWPPAWDTIHQRQLNVCSIAGHSLKAQLCHMRVICPVRWGEKPDDEGLTGACAPLCTL